MVSGAYHDVVLSATPNTQSADISASICALIFPRCRIRATRANYKQEGRGATTARRCADAGTSRNRTYVNCSSGALIEVLRELGRDGRCEAFHTSRRFRFRPICRAATTTVDAPARDRTAPTRARARRRGALQRPGCAFRGTNHGRRAGDGPSAPRAQRASDRKPDGRRDRPHQVPTARRRPWRLPALRLGTTLRRRPSLPPVQRAPRSSRSWGVR
jgi:hypothetical protein